MAISDVARRLDQLRRALLAEMIRIMASMDGAPNGVTVSSADNLRNAAAVRQQILAALRDAGVQVVEEEIERAAAEVAAQVLATAPGAADFAPRATARIETVLRGQIDQLANVWSDGADSLRLAIDRGVVSGLDLRELTDRVTAALEMTFAQAETVVNSAIMGVQRAALLEVGEESGEPLVYAYLGADDSKTRPFCAAHKDRAYTKAALDRLDNGAGQPKPVSVFLGGYNCRHTLAPMTPEDAAEEGYEVIA